MSLEVRLITKSISQILVSLILGCSFSACSLFDRQPEPSDVLIKKASRQRVFFAPYDQVWRAAHTIIKYPIATENQDTGLLETEFVKQIDGWIPPESPKPTTNGLRYKLVMIFSKGKIDNRESTRVTIEKKVEKQKDFFSDPDQLDSDGLEEKVIFYRLEREILISDSLKRAVETK